MKIKAENKAVRQQAGYTLIELSITVAIIAVLVMTGLYGVPRILDTNKVTNTTQQITLATANYSKLASTSTETTWATGPTVAYVTGTAVPLAGMGIWADENILKSTVAGVTTAYGLQHAFGNFIYSRNATTGIAGFIGANEGYILKLEKIPAKNCFAVASSFGNTAIQIEVDATAAPTAGPIAAEPTGATIVKAAGTNLNMTTLANTCQTNPSAAKTIYLWFQY